MIINIPSPEDLNDVALRLYFSAWSDLINMLAVFDQHFEVLPEEELTDERRDYLELCQPELQSIVTVIQQSNELRLKAMICEISPLLLLLGNDQKLNKIHKDTEFSEFKTLDSVELPGAVNVLCKEPLTDKFIQSYNAIRSLRNKISHLGKVDNAFNPHDLIRTLVFQYTELWKGRLWLDCLECASQTRISFFYDGRYSSAEEAVMGQLPFTVQALTNSEFQQLFGHSKRTRRYLCHSCIYKAETKFSSPELDACKTAFLEKDGLALSCVMCGERFKVLRLKCESAGCKGNVIGNNDDEYVGTCHSCGENQEADS